MLYFLNNQGFILSQTCFKDKIDLKKKSRDNFVIKNFKAPKIINIIIKKS